MICRDTHRLRELLAEAHDDGAEPLVIRPVHDWALDVRRKDGSEPSETEQIEIAALEATCAGRAPGLAFSARRIRKLVRRCDL